MKTLLEYIFEAYSEYDKLMTILHDPNSKGIKSFILDKGIYKVLNILGRNGAPMRNKSIQWKLYWGTTSKRSTEYARGEFGRTPENFKNNINYIFQNILGLSKSDYELSEPALNKNVSSNSKLSIKVNMEFKVNDSYYKDEFYICNRQLSANGKEIILQDKYLNPVNIIQSTKLYKSKKELLNDIKNGLNNSLQNLTDKEMYIDLLYNICLGIINSKDNINALSMHDLINLDKLHKYKFEINNIDMDVFNSLDSTSINNIVVVFGEILSGLALMNMCDEFNNIYWPNNNERLNDLYFNNLGISVKRKNSSTGHIPEVASIANIIYKSLDELGVDDENDISIEQLNTIKNNLGLDNINSTQLRQFKNDIKAFFKIGENNKNIKNREDILWDISFEVLGNNKDFKQLLKLLNIKSRSNCDETYILKYMDSLSESERNNIINYCIEFANVTKKDKVDRGWIVNAKTGIDREKNYSKIMRALQLRVCDELNKRYTSNNETSDLFSVFVTNVIKSIQTYIDIKPLQDSIILTYNLENMENGKYIFKPAGSTWNQWRSHGNIGFKIV